MSDEQSPAEARRNRIYGEINAERYAQNGQWGGAAHDSDHEEEDWLCFIEKQVRLARAWHGWEKFRPRLIKIAALAVAAIEAGDRQYGGKE